MAIDRTLVPGLSTAAAAAEKKHKAEFKESHKNFLAQLGEILTDPATKYPQATALMKFLTEGLASVHAGGHMSNFAPAARQATQPQPTAELTNAQAQVEELTRSESELTAKVESLEAELETEKQKTLPVGTVNLSAEELNKLGSFMEGQLEGSSTTFGGKWVIPEIQKSHLLNLAEKLQSSDAESAIRSL